MMRDALSKANYYRQEAAKCYELAKSSPPGFLRHCYQRVATQYLFLAEDELKLVEQQSHLAARGRRSSAARRSRP
jgi:hypothetical protein